MRAGLRWALVLGAMVAGCGEEDASGPLCAPSDVAGALQVARSGDAVRLGACTIEGAFVVPGGVSLVGAGVGQTRVVAPEAGIGLDLAPGLDDVTTLSDLTVEARGVVGVRAEGPGRVAVERVTVEASAGIALGIVAATDVVLREVDLLGPVTSENAGSPVFLDVAPTADVPAPSSCSGDPSCEPEATQSVDCPGCGQVLQVCDACGRWVTVTAAYGLALEAVDVATLESVNVRGFASFGVVLRDRSTEGEIVAGVIDWSAGSISQNLGVGLYAGGALTLALDGVTIEETLSGVRGTPSYGALVVDGVALTTTNLTLLDNDRYGLLQRAATAHHTTLEATGNGDAALWVGGSDGFSIEGGTLRGNAFAGIVLVESSGVALQDLEVSATAQATRTLGLWGRVEIGDGLQLTDTTERVSLTRVDLIDNARVGLLIDLGDAEPSPVQLTDVTVSAQGSALGAVAGAADPDTQELTPGGPPGWDDGITRQGAAAANDLVAAPLDYVGSSTPDELQLPGIVTPCD